MPTVRILKHIKDRSIERFDQNQQKHKRMIASHVMDDENDTAVHYSPTTSDKLKPSIPTFDGHNWNYDDNKWIPPDATNPETHTAPHDNSIKTVKAQSDSGANRIVTDQLSLLSNIKHITPTPMGGCNKEDDIAILCTSVGMLPITTATGDTIKVLAYYSAQVDGTIISPTAIVSQHRQRFSGWIQYSDCDNKNGYIQLIGRSNQDDLKLPTVCENDLWYHAQSSLGNNGITGASPKINRLSNAAKYELWHQRLGHAGSSVMQSIHNHCKGIPPLKGNAFFRCPSCMSGKLCTKRSIGKRPKPKLGSSAPVPPETQPSTPLINDDTYLPAALPGQHFHMDFGFVRGAEYSIKTEDGKTLTSRDGKKAYLLVIDRSSRYTWIFLTDSKKPPVATVKSLLNKFKSTNPHRTVRVDQGGDLGKSQAFKDMIAEAQFSLELTGNDASASNGMAENPNKMLGQMMRCMLHSSELGPEYWSWALTQAVYIKNRIPHQSIKTSPYQKFTGTIPDLSGLRIFGSKVYVRQSGKRRFKLDHNASHGIFLGYTATDKNVLYIDQESGKVKTGTHVIFDEAHMSEAASKAPLAAQTLQRLGYYANEDYVDEVKNGNQSEHLLIQRLTDTSILPKRATKQSIGYDLFADTTQTLTIPAGTVMPFTTGIAIQCPEGTYARIAPRSGLTLKKNLTTLAGVIDPDYRGNLTVLLRNFGDSHQEIQPGDRIAQLILEQALTAATTEVKNLTTTERGTAGFGSTDTAPSRPAVKAPLISTEAPKITPATSPIITATPKAPIKLVDRIPQSLYPMPDPIPAFGKSQSAAAAKLFQDIQVTFEEPYAIHLDNSPYDNHTHRIIDIKKNNKHKTLGLILAQCPHRNLPTLQDCEPSTAAMRIPRWRSELKGAYITSVNDTPVATTDEVENLIQIAIQSKSDAVKIHFSTIDRQAMHPQYGIPQMYHDQLNVIGKHLWELKNDPSFNTNVDEEAVCHASPTIIRQVNSLSKKKFGKHHLWHLVKKLPRWYKIAALKKRRNLTRRLLLQQSDWPDWQKSEWKQLNQYEAQKTFGEPCALPKGANLLPLLWTYIIKDCGTKKARCVCNGSPKMKGTVTLGDTYAGSLEQTGSRIFWAATAMNNFITIGADASNAFAEAPPPKAPLYVNIDAPFCEWYKTKYPDKPKIPRGFVLPVQGALQGHPESPRLWAKLIDRIIKELNLQPCTHEPCLYFTNNYNNQNKRVLFLRQVDDFAVSCEDKATAKHVIAAINSKMTIDVKDLGIITRFNGVDITQTRDFIKLSNKTYIEKIFSRHAWLHEEKVPLVQHPVPMIADTSYQRKLETAEAISPDDLPDIEEKFGFRYRQAIRELIYALVTCRPDLSYSVIKLSQYSSRPSEIHFEALQHIYRYLDQTKDEGIHFWRREPRPDLPTRSITSSKEDNNYDQHEIHERQQPSHNVMFGAVDSDYAGDVSHRRSVTGIVLRIAGGTVLYKTKFQDTVAMSSTEAEFTAAAEAGKYILYVRSILDEIGIPQHAATVLYEDNQGALLMANAQQPTKRTRHMDIKTFVLQQWVERDLIRLKRINTSDNYSDVLTKATGRTLFHRHMNYILGKISPSYITETTDRSHSSCSAPRDDVSNTGG